MEKATMFSLSAIRGLRVKAIAPQEIRVQVVADTDIIAARQKGRELARDLGFTLTEATLVTTAVSELARNIIFYAKRGEIIFGIVQKGSRRGLKIIARDDGPGIPDIENAMAEGFSTSGGLGLGLPGVKRLMDEFNIVSKIGSGTTVTVKKWSPNTDRSPLHYDEMGRPIPAMTERFFAEAEAARSPKVAGRPNFALEVTEEQMDRKRLEDSKTRRLEQSFRASRRG